MANMGLGLTLMVVGMVTVFSILLIVINLSKLLIQIVNTVAPEEEVSHRKPEPAPAAVDAVTMDIIHAAVAQITKGKGVVASVEKL